MTEVGGHMDSDDRTKVKCMTSTFHKLKDLPYENNVFHLECYPVYRVVGFCDVKLNKTFFPSTFI